MKKTYCRPGRSPKFTGGGKLIFQDLYVYIFVELKNFLAYMSAYCLQISEKVNKSTFFSRAPASKRRILEGFARKREKILCYRSLKIAPFEGEKGVNFWGFRNLGEGAVAPLPPLPLRPGLSPPPPPSRENLIRAH